MGRHGAEDPTPAHTRRADERQMSWKRRAASAVTTSAVIVGLGTLAYGSTHTYLGFISEPPKHESAPGPPTSATPPTAPPSMSLTSPASPAPERPTGRTRDTVRPKKPAPSATPPEPRVTSTPRTPKPRGTLTPRPAPKVTFDYEATPDGASRFNGSVTIHNLDDEPIESWKLALAFSDARVSSVLDSLGEPTLNGLIAGGLLGPPSIAPGASLTVKFTAEGDASGGVGCRFNDDPCILS